MAPIRRFRSRKKEAADLAQTCLDALRLLGIARDAPVPAEELASEGAGLAGDASTPMQQVQMPASPVPSPPQEDLLAVSSDAPAPAEERASGRPGPAAEDSLPLPQVQMPAKVIPSQPQEIDQVEPEPDTSNHPSPPQSAEEAQQLSRVERNIRAVLKAMLEMGALADERYALYLGESFKAYLQSPTPIDPPPMLVAAGSEAIKDRYPYLAGEVARTGDAVEEREMLARGLLQLDAATLAALEGEFLEATFAGKEAMLAKLQAEVEYAKARADTEAMIEMLAVDSVAS